PTQQKRSSANHRGPRHNSERNPGKSSEKDSDWFNNRASEAEIWPFFFRLHRSCRGKGLK
ncbi:hypothetical protein BgiBS90_018350, partial [Biomphalaria glabrata]